MFFAPQRIQRIVEELGTLIYRDKKEITDIRFRPCGYRAYGLVDEPDDEWEIFPRGGKWGGKDLHCWFRSRFRLPAEFAGKKTALLLKTGSKGWDALNPQFLVYVNGVTVQGADVNHTEILLDPKAEAGKPFRVDLFGYSGMQDEKAGLSLTLCTLDPEVEALYYNLQVPLEVCKLLDEQDIRRIKALNYLTDAVNMLDLRQPQSEGFLSSIRKANRYLETEFYGKFCGHGDVTEICVGHTHIDVAWLWTLSQTREKAVRSFATVLNLMKQYPDYIFLSSQPQLYQFVKEDRPDLFEEIKKMIRAGRWEAEGAMWLEADCNLTSGESLVRQILYGKRFFRREFGVDSKIVWLPDTFGYSAALPQIMKRSGVDYFMTTKISWNEFNRIPYDTFYWVGIDGTKVLTHFITTQDFKPGEAQTGTTYNGDTTPSQVKGCWQRYQQKEINTEVLNSYGFGDGGGGPTKTMLERLKRLDKGIPGCPKTKEGTALSFFQNLEKRVSSNRRLPEWVGELYLEYHRGTYTTMARNKKFNRKAEFRNEDAELFSSMASLLCGAPYPQSQLSDCWHTTLLNQFHDILPGSAIKQVYETSKTQYEALRRTGTGLIANALSKISSHIEAKTMSVAVFNQLGFKRNGTVKVKLPEGWRSAEILDSGHPLPVQNTEGGNILFYGEDIPSKGYKVFEIRQSDAPADFPSGGNAGADGMENQFFSIKIGKDGTMTSIFDKKNGRELLQPGKRGNTLQAFEDKPFNFDAWNIDIYYQEKMWEVDGVTDIRAVENGPVRWGVRVTRKFLSSTIEQTYFIYRDIPRIDFHTVIDWKEKQILLKAVFPVDIHADKASYEIQYGNVERPTHWNTSWDWARFEVCAHKWADLSEGGYGVSLLNDCKYGHDIRDSVMRLSLLRSPVSPNEDADRERHEFTYSLYPHRGGWRQAKTEQFAYSLNCPLYSTVMNAQDGVLPGRFSFVKADADNVVIEVVKHAEDSGDTVVRLFEYKNERSEVTLTFGRPVSEAWECSLLEEKKRKMDVRGDRFRFPIKPYEIRTFRIRF